MRVLVYDAIHTRVLCAVIQQRHCYVVLDYCRSARRVFRRRYEILRVHVFFLLFIFSPFPVSPLSQQIERRHGGARP